MSGAGGGLRREDELPLELEDLAQVAASAAVFVRHAGQGVAGWVAR